MIRGSGARSRRQACAETRPWPSVTIDPRIASNRLSRQVSENKRLARYLELFGYLCRISFVMRVRALCARIARSRVTRVCQTLPENTSQCSKSLCQNSFERTNSSQPASNLPKRGAKLCPSVVWRVRRSSGGWSGLENLGSPFLPGAACRKTWRDLSQAKSTFCWPKSPKLGPWQT
jgi:hypothetical protein